MFESFREPLEPQWVERDEIKKIQVPTGNYINAAYGEFTHTNSRTDQIEQKTLSTTKLAKEGKLEHFLSLTEETSSKLQEIVYELTELDQLKDVRKKHKAMLDILGKDAFSLSLASII